MREIIVVLFILLFLAGFSWSAYSKEEQLKHGDTLIVRLAPCDPRAFLLGDYMALNYAMNSEVDKSLFARGTNGEDPFISTARRNNDITLKLPHDGVAVVRLDASKVASFIRLDDGSLLRNDERRLYFRVGRQGAKIAASAFYFQEGYAKDFDRAQYGELRVDAAGKSLLVHLLDSELQRIQPRKEKTETKD